MRKEVLIGGCLALAAALAILVSDWLDLELEAVALFGALMGAIAAIVPSGSPISRLAGFLAGFAIAFVGFLLRAAMLPDTSSGRAVAAALIVVACTGVALATVGRVRLWTVLLGAAAFTGAYEYTYNAAPPEVLTTSVSAATSLLLSAGVGWLAVSWLAPEPAVAGDVRRDGVARAADTDHHHETVPLTTMMEDKR
jgi:hypothetical protein